MDSDENRISASINGQLKAHAAKAAETEKILFSYSVPEYSCIKLWDE